MWRAASTRERKKGPGRADELCWSAVAVRKACAFFGALPERQGAISSGLKVSTHMVRYDTARHSPDTRPGPPPGDTVYNSTTTLT